MTETSILPGAEPSTDEGVDMVPPGTGPEEPDDGHRRRLMIIGAIAGVIVLAAAAYMLLHKSPSTPAPFVPRSGAVHTTTPSHAPKPSKGNGNPKTLPKKANHPTVRDPFNPLLLAPVATNGAPASTTKVTAPTTAPVPTTGTAPVPQPTAPTTTTPGSGNPANGSPLWIELMKTRGRSAVFDVGYAHHSFRKFVVQAPKATSQHGTVFDKVFALIGVQNGQVTLQIGDATPFDLAKGVSHTV
jgi:hypothetical protein